MTRIPDVPSSGPAPQVRARRRPLATLHGTAVTLDDHRQGFAAAIAVLVAEFNAYLDRSGADPFADSANYRQGTLWCGPDELDATLTSTREIITPLTANTPGPGRRPYLISPIVFPGEEPPAPS
jgi:hypothetical protein